MFTWICPQCGREVPPAYNECPDCAARTAAGSAPPGAVAPPQQSMAPAPPPAPRGGRRPLWATGPQEPLQPAPPQPAPPQPTTPPVDPPPTYQLHQPASPMFQPAPPQPPQYAPPQPAGPRFPTWMMAVLSAVVFGAILGGVYLILNSRHSAKPAATVESPAAKPGASQNPLQKYIEVTGVRFAPASKGLQVTFVLVNHSDTDLVGLAGNVTLWGRTQKSEEDAVGTFTFQTSMAAKSSKELTMPLTTKLKMMETPDWQNVTMDVQITAPPGA